MAMLQQPASLAQAQQAALNLGAAHRGAAQRTAQALAAVLAEKRP